MTKSNTAAGDTFILSTHPSSYSQSVLSLLTSEPFMINETGKLSPRTFSIFLLEDVNILLPLCGTSNRPCHAICGYLSYA